MFSSDDHMSLTFHTQPRIIAICGYAGHGKDSIGDMLFREHNFARMAFADPMRRMLEALLSIAGLPSSYIYDRQLKEQEIPGLGFSYRQLAQTLGTEWARKCLSEDFWVRTMAQRVNAAVNAARNPNVVITDLRFPNEEAWLRTIGAVIVKVSRPNMPAVRVHESEAYVAGIKEDIHIFNDGSLLDLRARVYDQLGQHLP